MTNWVKEKRKKNLKIFNIENEKSFIGQTKNIFHDFLSVSFGIFKIIKITII